MIFRRQTRRFRGNEKWKKNDVESIAGGGDVLRAKWPDVFGRAVCHGRVRRAYV